VAFSVSSTALDYLKQQLLPYVYNKIGNLHIDDKSFSEVGVKFDLTNINIHIPQPDNDVINHWVPKMHSETNSISVTNNNQDLTVEFDFVSHLSIFRLMSGHFKANIQEIKLLLDLKLT
jgi:hypothetical protein